MRKIFFVLTIIFCGVSVNDAQTADTDDNQFWNDVSVSVPVNTQLDFTLWGTARFGKNITRLNEGRIAVGFIYKPNKSWLLQPFYWRIRARNGRGEFLTEQRLNFRTTYRFPFKKFGLAHRSWFEHRRRQPRNSWRYRPSLTFEKDVGSIISGTRFFATEEIFYDSTLKKFSRNRLSFGITKTLTKNLSLDIFYLRQNDGFSRPSKAAFRKSYVAKLLEIGLAEINKKDTPIHAPFFSTDYNTKTKIMSVTSGNLRTTNLGRVFLESIDFIGVQKITE